MTVGWIVVAGNYDEVLAHLRDGLSSAGKSQTDLAAHLGISTSYMSELVNGKTGLSIPRLFAILDYLDMGITMAP